MNSVLVFLGHSFLERMEFPTQELANAFADGANYGAGKFGGDDLCVFVLPNDEREVRNYFANHPEELKKAGLT